MRSESRRGTAAVEFAITLPFIFGILAGIWEIGSMVNARQAMTVAVREAGRQASAGRPKNELSDVIHECLQRDGYNTGQMSVFVDETATLPDGAEVYSIKATLPVGALGATIINHFSVSTKTITVESFWPRS